MVDPPSPAQSRKPFWKPPPHIALLLQVGWLKCLGESLAFHAKHCNTQYTQLFSGALRQSVGWGVKPALPFLSHPAFPPPLPNALQVTCGGLHNYPAPFTFILRGYTQ